MRILRQGQAIILEPLVLESITTDWTWLDALSGPLDDDFRQAALNRPPGVI